MHGLPILQVNHADDAHQRYSVPVILGWDIGGVNTKVACLDERGLTVRSRSFELQREPAALVRVLQELAGEVDATTRDPLICAVTMTAELSQMFRTKGDGVRFVLAAVMESFPSADIRVFSTEGRFLAVDEAVREPIAVAAANWAATARIVAQRHPTALLVDVGTTTTDIIPIVDGRVVSVGMTDPERLASGELLYTGVLRTPVEAMVRDVPYRDGRASVSAESFALIGDVHFWRGRLAASDFTVPTPDGRPVTREFAGERIARVICADRELLAASEITAIAEAIAAQQIATVTAAIERVRSHHSSIRIAVVTGLGEFIAAEAAHAAGLDVRTLAADIGFDAARYAPAAAVALLLQRARLAKGPAKAGHYGSTSVGHCGPTAAGPGERAVDLVVKVGGGLLAHIEQLDRVLAAIAEVARSHRVLIVPGGGPFADAVRDVDARVRLGNDQAHWMAVLAMDQYAHLLAARLRAGVIVSTRDDIETAAHAGRIPVIAPSRWMSATDPLPHTWQVTSDSIAAWVAGALGATRLLLVKPPDARGADLVDAYFQRSRPPAITCDCLPTAEAIQLLDEIAGRDRADAGARVRAQP